VGIIHSTVEWVPRAICTMAIKLTAAEGMNEWSCTSSPASRGWNRYNFNLTFTTVFIDVCIIKSMLFRHSNVVPIL
jgi:hypothetical protein